MKNTIDEKLSYYRGRVIALQQVIKNIKLDKANLKMINEEIEIAAQRIEQLDKQNLKINKK